MSWEEFNYSSFMGVINATKQDEKGILIPGECMPSGKPVRAEGVKLDQLLKGQDARAMAEQWFNSVKGQYERELEERDHQTSTRDVPDLVIGGGDTAAPEPERGEVANPPAGASLEEELQARCTRWAEAVERLDSRLADLEAERREAHDQLIKCEKALDAVRS